MRLLSHPISAGVPAQRYIQHRSSQHTIERTALPRAVVYRPATTVAAAVNTHLLRSFVEQNTLDHSALTPQSHRQDDRPHLLYLS